LARTVWIRSGASFYRGQRTIPLSPKAADVLLLLVERAGDVVEKDELLKHVWRDAFVEEGSLTRTIFILRKALECEESAFEYIATIPKRGYRFATPVAEIAAPSSAKYLGRKIMVAVLPFENLSGKKSQEYFSDGLTEEMITQLGRLDPGRLGVIARTSAMHYKSGDKSVQQIGRELGVSHVLEGSVRRVGGRARITAQLIQVNDQTHLWADTYDRDLGDILQVQADVARAIAAQIEIKLTPKQQKRLASAGSVNTEAYEAYLKGLYLWNRRSLDALHRSVQHFQRAIEKDPSYAAAYTGLADAYLTLQDNGHMSPRKATALAKKAAQKAIGIDDALAEAHNSLAHVYFHSFNWRDAEREWNRAIELNPNYVAAHLYYANYLAATGCTEIALVEAQRAQTLDPASLPAACNTATIYSCAGQYDDAIRVSQQTLDTDPSFARAYEDLGRAYESKMMYANAITALQKATKLSNDDSRFCASLAHAYAIGGNRKAAFQILKRLKERSRKSYVSPYSLAVVAVGLGDRDSAFDWLEQAYNLRSEALPFVRVDPRLKPLHSEPRFRSLIRRLDLPK
jgi:TolB-like protein/Tfp pilus assembly protein PilF